MTATTECFWTKEQEVQHFEEFVRALPEESYLRSILGELPGMVSRMIYDDFGYSIAGTLRQLESDRAYLAKSIKDAEKRRDEVQAHVRQLEQAVLGDIRNQARAIANAK